MHIFLQDRDDDFYAKYLQELKHEKLNQGKFLIKKGDRPQSVIFIMQGVLKNITTGKFFKGG